MDSAKLLKVIKKIVKEEVKTQVKLVLNEVLAEHFLANLSRPSNLSQTISEVAPVKKQQIQEDKIRQQEKIEERKRKIQNLAGDDYMMASLFEDVDENPQMPSGFIGEAVLTASGVIDSDDDGVDLSLFNRK